MGLGHADGEAAEALGGVAGDLGGGLLGQLDAVGAVDLAGDSLDLLSDRSEIKNGFFYLYFILFSPVNF